MSVFSRPNEPRLGVVTNYFPSLTETFIYREMAALKRHGIEVRVFSVRRPPERDVAEEVRPLRERTRYLLPSRWGRLAAAHLWWLARKPLCYLSTLLLLVCGRHYSLRDRLRTVAHFAVGVLVAREAARENIGHLHAHYASHPATIALAAARLLKISFSFTGHAYDIWLDRLLLPQKMRSCSFAVTCTEAGGRALLKEAPGGDPAKVYTVYHGVDIEHFSPPAARDAAEEDREPRILSVGRLDRQKGFHLLIEALGVLRREGREFRLTIVGGGPWRERLEARAASEGLADVVSFPGRVYHERLPAYYRDADLFVLPCFNDDGNTDNLPNVLLEAMACAVPVISTRLQGIPELVQDGLSGLLVEERDVAALTAAIRSCLTDGELARRLGLAGRKRVVESFDLAQSGARLAGLYGKHLRGKGASGVRRPSSLKGRISVRYLRQTQLRPGQGRGQGTRGGHGAADASSGT
ncbi:MAG: glycosyltransferase family 4 protein [Pseudomonadota bacterium]